MRDRRDRGLHTGCLAIALVAGAALPLFTTGVARGEERKFVVMLAHSPKTFLTNGAPGLPPGGLPSVDVIEDQYFDTMDPTIDSFVEYWEEISYGDVTVSGLISAWVTVPWAFDPNPPNAALRASPVNFINLRTSSTISENSPLEVPEPYAYGAGEDFCDVRNGRGSDDISTGIFADNCGTLILTNPNGGPPGGVGRAAGMIDTPVVRMNVWTPGERFLDMDGDAFWDALDENSDRMCHGPNGCLGICAPSVCSITGGACDTSLGTLTPKACPAETCVEGACTLTGGPCVITSDCPQQSCVVGTGICTVGGSTATPCRRDADCTVSGETCGDGALCGKTCVSNSDCPISGEFCGPGGICRGTGASCDRNAHCGFGEFCVGVCSSSRLLCENRNDCPNPREVCTSFAGSEQPCNDALGAVCLNDNETCGDPVGSGPRGCNSCGCGDLFCPIDWNGNTIIDNPSQCVIPLLVPCTSNAHCGEVPVCNGGSRNGEICFSDVNCPLGGTCNRLFATDPLHLSSCRGGFCVLDNSPTFTRNAPPNCAPDVQNLSGLMPDCCDSANQSAEDFTDCMVASPLNPRPVNIADFPGAEGIVCGDVTRLCCEFFDFDDDSNIDVVEPFEDFMIRWEPSGRTIGTTWVRVDEKYVRDNYPGDVEKLIQRTGNRYYNSPDLFFDRGSTKMMQDAGANEFAWRVPKPGMRKTLGAGVLGQGSAFLVEETWFDQWWGDRYGTTSTPPTWPGSRCSTSDIACDESIDCPGVETCEAPADPNLNSPRFRPFSPADPVPPSVNPTTGPSNRWFQPDNGGCGSIGSGTAPDNHLPRVCGGADLNLGSDSPPFRILPEDVFGYYDGWVEHDDVPSSKYHSEGDKRLGEVTSPGSDVVVLSNGGTGMATYTAIFGADLGRHDANVPLSNPDTFNVAAGPYAVNIHGEKGFDAGDVCMIEWLTWRTDGTSPTVGYQWEIDNGPYHPFAGRHNRCSNSTFTKCSTDADCPGGTCTAGSRALGFRDYNLDGMIDQGEVRPELSENYSVDSNPDTANDGTNSDYPFNRRRLIEDVIEALDESIDWNDFTDVNTMNARECLGESNLADFADPAHPDDPDHNRTITAAGFVSGIVIVPPGAYADTNLFPLAPNYYPVHNEDADDPSVQFPAGSTVHRDFDLHFHDLVICSDCRTASPGVIAYAAHEYGHTWEGFPDLYDFDVFGGGVDEENCPVGAWDIMAGISGEATLVHPTPILKESRCTEWIVPVDLATVVTPGVETSITLPPAALVRDNSYYFLENEDRPGEKYWFWSAGSGFDERLPGEGLLIMRTNIEANDEGLPLQQRTAPWTYEIIQADGLRELQACSSGGNNGDAGDIWPGSTNKTQFNHTSNPPADWDAENSWTGLDISNIVPDGEGSVLITLTWTPTNIPSLRFLTPPGGESVNSLYQVRFETTDVFGGTTISLFFIEDQKTCRSTGEDCTSTDDCPQTLETVPNLCLHDVDPAKATAIASFPKTTPGTSVLSKDWNLLSGPVADGRYVLFAELTPGPTPDGVESSFTRPRGGRSNAGNGGFGLCNDSRACSRDDQCGPVQSCTIATDAIQIAPGKSRSETWTVTCIDLTCTNWRVNSTITQPVLTDDDPNQDAYDRANPGVLYTSVGGEISFTLKAGTEPFTLGDIFTFTTTGITAVSQGVTVTGGRITTGPIADIFATPLSIRPGETVSFDGRGSKDPNGEPLVFTWDFGDGSPEESGPIVNHTYVDAGDFSARLRVTNPLRVRFDEATVDINVINNSPTASMTATPSSGTATLAVQFDGSASSDQETPADELIYQWNFGDGTSANDLGVGKIGDTNSFILPPIHSYSKRADGTDCTPDDTCVFFAQLTITDGLGKQAFDSIEITVGNSQPVARVTITPESGPVPLTVEFDATASSDPDGDNLTILWKFGDGETASRPVSEKVTHTYTTINSFSPSATVSDGHDGTSTWLGSIVVQPNNPPVAEIAVRPVTERAFVGEEFTFDGSASSDPDGSIESYEWDFGDGSDTQSDVVVTHAFTATAVDGIDVTLTVKDAGGLSSTTSVTVTVLPNPGNRPPTAHISTLPTACTEPCQLTLDASLSFDLDGDDLNFEWTIFRLTDDVPTLTDTFAGRTVEREFKTPGRYQIVLEADDQKGGIGRDGPVLLIVSEQLEPEPGQDTPPADGGEIPDSASQRPIPTLCGLGMVMSFAGSLLGLLAMGLTRRRFM